MDLLWPGFLLLLGLIPLLIGGYILMLRRRRRYAVRFSSLALVREALPHQSRVRRHIPFALFLVALTSLIVTLARPVDLVSVPAIETTIILTIDVSRSMRQSDIAPSRLAAAQDAALDFIQRQKAGTRIGIVAFAGFAELIQAPTTDKQALRVAVQSLTTARRTAIGSGILKSLDVIAEFDKSIAPVLADTASGDQPPPVPNGAYVPSIVVLLTDGVSTTGPEPLEAAQFAVDRGVRVYTIGFGTEMGDMSFGIPQSGGSGGQSSGNDPFFGGFRRGIDEETLQEIAERTGAEYYAASSAGELQQVFENLPTHLITRTEITEISVAFAIIGALMAAAAIVLSMLWNPLI